MQLYYLHNEKKKLKKFYAFLKVTITQNTYCINNFLNSPPPQAAFFAAESQGTAVWDPQVTICRGVGGWGGTRDLQEPLVPHQCP